MSKIRSDLVGVVFVQAEGGSPTALAAGDTIPDGVVVGPHLLDDVEPGDAAEPKAPRGNASRDAWAEYAASLDLEVAEDATREDIKALVEAKAHEEAKAPAGPEA